MSDLSPKGLLVLQYASFHVTQNSSPKIIMEAMALICNVTVQKPTKKEQVSSYNRLPPCQLPSWEGEQE